MCVAGVLAGAIAVSGCSSDASPLQAAGSPGVGASGGSKVTIATYAADDGSTSTAVLTGAIGDHGTGDSVTGDGKTDPEHNGRLRLTLQQGTFQLDTAALDKKVVAAFGRLAVDPRTCSER